jgi:prevent-host-death family protein
MREIGCTASSNADLSAIHSSNMSAREQAVELKELRRHISNVLARVRQGETIDITEHGRLIARIIPVAERQPSPILDRLVASGRDACEAAWLPPPHITFRRHR